MSARPAAELIGPEARLRHRIAERLTEASWSVAEPGTSDGALDLGVFIPSSIPPTPLATTAPSTWWSSVTGNLTPAFRSTKRLIPRLSGSSGALVFVASILGEIGGPNQTAFSATSAGIVGFVKALTLDVPDVRFSVVAAAWPAPDERWSAADVDWGLDVGTTDVESAIADAVLFLANDRSGHHRGQVIRIPSGITT